MHILWLRDQKLRDPACHVYVVVTKHWATPYLTDSASLSYLPLLYIVVFLFVFLIVLKPRVLHMQGIYSSSE